MLATGMRFDDLPGWEFVVTERSAGAFVVSAEDRSGTRVEVSGPGPDVLLLRCRAEVRARLDRPSG